MSYLRIELAGKCDDLLRIDDVHTCDESVPNSEIIQI